MDEARIHPMASPTKSGHHRRCNIQVNHTKGTGRISFCFSNSGTGTGQLPTMAGHDARVWTNPAGADYITVFLVTDQLLACKSTVSAARESESTGTSVLEVNLLSEVWTIS